MKTKKNCSENVARLSGSYKTGATTLNIMTFSITTLRIMTLSITTFSITKLSIATLYHSTIMLNVAFYLLLC